MMMHHPIIMSHSVTNVLVTAEEEKKKYLTVAEARHASFLLFVLVDGALLSCFLCHLAERSHQDKSFGEVFGWIKA